MNELKICIPGQSHSIVPKCKIKIGRFSNEIWEVNYGWFAFSGNREICGWYLISDNDNSIRPLQKIDLFDIYFMQR